MSNFSNAKTKWYLNITLIAALALVGIMKVYQHLVSPSFPLSETRLVDLQNQPYNFDCKETPFTIVAFFKTWCRDCAMEIPELEKLQNEQPYGKVRVILVSDEPLDELNKYRIRRKVKLPIYQSEKGLKDLGIHVFPTTYLINSHYDELLVKREGFDWASEKQVKDLLNKMP